MARKLYVFNTTGRARVDKQAAQYKWLGGYSSSYAYLGDHYARMLGVGNNLPTRRPPGWIQGQVAGNKQIKGGASRHDPGFRGWG